MKIILDLCGGTGSWSKPYADAGYDVRLVTMPEHDVRLWEYTESVYGILAAPPCTVFAASGARWERTEQEMLEALSVVDACLRLVLVCKPAFWALENPMGYLRQFLGKPKFSFHPYEFGDMWKKKTEIWGYFNEPKKIPLKKYGFLKNAFPCDHGHPTNRRKLPKLIGKIRKDMRTDYQRRAITPSGFARAFFEANR